jgi:hypothetical protein
MANTARALGTWITIDLYGNTSNIAKLRWHGTIDGGCHINPRYSNNVREPSSEGTVPINALTERSKYVNAVKAPSSEGTVPIKALE